MKSVETTPDRRAYAESLAAGMPVLIRAVIVDGVRFECPPAPKPISDGRGAIEGLFGCKADRGRPNQPCSPA